MPVVRKAHNAPPNDRPGDLLAYSQIGLHADAGLYQGRQSAVLGRHHDARCRLTDAGHDVGHVEGAGVDHDVAARATCAAHGTIACARYGALAYAAHTTLAALAAVIESRKVANGGDPDASYVSRLLHKGPDAFLKKIGEEATEVVMAAKDADHGGDASKIVYEVADLWFHTMVALSHYNLSPADVIAELERRVGTSGLEEKALRKVVAREAEPKADSH